MTRTGVALFFAIGVAWISFLSLVLPERETPANDLLRDVRQAPQPINPWRDK